MLLQGSDCSADLRVCGIYSVDMVRPGKGWGLNSGGNDLKKLSSTGWPLKRISLTGRSLTFMCCTGFSVVVSGLSFANAGVTLSDVVGLLEGFSSPNFSFPFSPVSGVEEVVLGLVVVTCGVVSSGSSSASFFDVVFSGVAGVVVDVVVALEPYCCSKNSSKLGNCGVVFSIFGFDVVVDVVVVVVVVVVLLGVVVRGICFKSGQLHVFIVVGLTCFGVVGCSSKSSSKIFHSGSSSSGVGSHGLVSGPKLKLGQRVDKLSLVYFLIPNIIVLPISRFRLMENEVHSGQIVSERQNTKDVEGAHYLGFAIIMSKQDDNEK
uniref:Transmembrane protein n=1 Tax=Glossina austeni TaxID=7395 RepID=A0A1A9VTN3_GLOAU